MYTKEQNQEIEKVIDAFADYIHTNPYFDVVLSEKIGYVLLDGISKDKDALGMAPSVLREGEELCEACIYNIACDTMENENGNKDFSNCTEQEKEAIRNALNPYIKTLPEKYNELVENLFS